MSFNIFSKVSFVSGRNSGKRGGKHISGKHTRSSQSSVHVSLPLLLLLSDCSSNCPGAKLTGYKIKGMDETLEYASLRSTYLLSNCNLAANSLLSAFHEFEYQTTSHTAHRTTRFPWTTPLLYAYTTLVCTHHSYTPIPVSKLSLCLLHEVIPAKSYFCLSKSPAIPRKIS